MNSCFITVEARYRASAIALFILRKIAALGLLADAHPGTLFMIIQAARYQQTVHNYAAIAFCKLWQTNSCSASVICG